MSTDANFGAWLREQRQKLDLTRERLAAEIGCVTDTIRMIETGRRRPSREVAELLARFMAVPPDEVEGFIQFARGLSTTAPAAPQPTARPPAARLHTLLTSAPTPLVGREGTTASLVELLGAARPRLLTLSGPPGIGKTSVASLVAAELQSSFPDGVYFVALAPLTDPALVAPTIARALGITPPPDRPLIESLHDYLWNRDLLLVLDNFEQLMPAAPLVGEMLRLAPKLKILVTSRGALRLRGEKEVALLPLEVPSAGESAAVVAASPAVRLFVERASEARSNFALTPDNAAVVAEICRRLDGLPLAIELAAARVRVLTPESMLPRLSRRLELLADGPVDLPDRQRTLRNAISWGYDLLTPGEQTLFRCMSVFVGGCTLQALEAIAWPEVEAQLVVGQARRSPGATNGSALPDAAATLLVALEALVRMSMVRLDGLDGAARFLMLETIREYGLEKLLESGAAESLRLAHAQFFVQFAALAARELIGPDQARWLEQLEEEHDNLRAALRWALDSGRSELALRLGGSLWRFWWVHSHWAEGSAWLREALQLDQRLAGSAAGEESNSAAPDVLALALTGAAILVRDQGDYNEAHLLMERSLALRRTLDDKEAIASALTDLGIVANDQERYAAGRALYEEAIALAQAANSKWQLSRALLNLSTLAKTQGNYEEARILVEQALQLSRELGHKANIGTCLHNLGIILFQLGDYSGARARQEESLAIRRALNDKVRVAYALTQLGASIHRQGDTATGMALLEESLTLKRELGARSGIGAALCDLGSAMLDEGDYSGAQLSLRESLKLQQESGSRESISYCLLWLAGSAVGLGRPGEAAWLLGSAAALREMLGLAIAPADTTRYERIMSTGMALLDDAAWEQAWAEGYAMPLADTVQAILREA